LVGFHQSMRTEGKVSTRTPFSSRAALQHIWPKPYLWIVHTANTDKTRLSCLVGVRGVNWVRGSHRQFSIYWRQNSFVLFAVRMHLWTSLDPVSKYDVTVGNHVVCELETGSGQDKTQLSQLISHFETGQNCFEIFSRRQCCLVTNSVHTANTDKTRLS